MVSMDLDDSAFVHAGVLHISDRFSDACFISTRHRAWCSHRAKDSADYSASSVANFRFLLCRNFAEIALEFLL